MVISHTQAFNHLMDRRIRIEWTFKPLDFSLRHINEFTCKFFSNVFLFGSTVPHAFAGGPIPNDLDMEVEISQSVTADNIKHWLMRLVQQPVPNGLIRPIPKKKGWVVNLTPTAQVIFKFPFQRLQGLSVLDGLKMSMQTGQLSMHVGDRLVTDPTEFDQLMQKIRRRDIENGVTQDIRAQGRFLRILHYIGHGAKLTEQDLLLEDFFRYTQPFDVHQQYVKHLQNHFPTETGKLVDYLNFLTLIKDCPERCRQVSQIVWNERYRLQMLSFAPLASCIAMAPHLTPHLLQFVRGVLLHSFVTKNGSSSVKAWHLPFLEGEIRPFFWIKYRNTCRYVAMDSPGKEQTPHKIVMEFLSAWELLETELPKCGFHFENFVSTFRGLGILFSNDRDAMIKELTFKPHLQRLCEHFPSDALFQKIDWFQSSLQAPWMSPEMRIYAQDKLRRVAVNPVHSLPQRVQKCSSRMINYWNTQGHFLSFINACLNREHLYAYALKAIDHVGAIPPELRGRLLGVLKETHSKLPKAPRVFREGWVKTALQLKDSEIHKKYLAFLSSGKFFREDPLTILLQLRQQMRQSRSKAHEWLQKLQACRQGISHLSQEKRVLFNDVALKMLPAPDGTWVPFIERFIALMNRCQMFDNREKERVYHIQAQNAALVGPSQQASVVLNWIYFRQSAFGSAFVLPIEPIMKTMQRLNSFPDEAEKPYWNLLQDLRAQKSDVQQRILEEIAPFFAQDEEGYMGTRLLHFLQKPDQYNKQLQQICLKRVVSPQKKKRSVPKVRASNRYTSVVLGSVELNAAFLSNLFKQLLSQHAIPKMEECLAIAEKYLEGKSLSAFKGEIRARIQSERSYPDPTQIKEFIRETAELLPIYNKFSPSKAILRFEALVGKFGESSKQFPSDFSSLLFKAQECGLKSSCKPTRWYHFHTSAINYYVDTIHWKELPFNQVLEHFQEANQTVHTPDPVQRKEMIHAHRAFALSFLKLAVRDFDSSSNWLKFSQYMSTILVPYLQNDKYRSDGLGEQCVQDLLIALSGIPAIFKVLSKLDFRKGTLFDLMKEFVKHKSELPKILAAHGHETILKRIKSTERAWLLDHVIDMMPSFSEKDAVLFNNMKQYTLHRKLCNKLSYLLMFLHEGGILAKPGVTYVTHIQVGNFLKSHGDLMEWEAHCDCISWEGLPPPPADHMQDFFFTITSPKTLPH